MPFLHPKLLKEWNWNKNSIINPFKLHEHSGKKVWWICSKKHEWECSINGRTGRNKHYGCPYCSNNLPSKENNLSLYSVAKEFHPTKNGDLKPYNLMPKSSKKIWWKCKRGHDYLARLSDRTSKNSGCPDCHNYFSQLEVRVFSEIIYLFKRAKLRYKYKNIEIDIFIPEINIGIEVDGSFWHKNWIKRDRSKNKALKKLGIKLIRLREYPLKIINKYDIKYKYEYNQNNYFNLIKKIFIKINKITGFNVKKYLSLKTFVNQHVYEKVIYENSYPKKSIANVSLKAVKLWHPTKNKMLPTQITYGSQQKAWWLCGKGHEWEAIVATIVNGHGCPFCSGRRVSENNCLGVKSPYLIKEWDKKKNGKLTPFDVSVKSNKKVWWKCKNGHSSLTTIAGKRKNSCEKCYRG